MLLLHIFRNLLPRRNTIVTNLTKAHEELYRRTPDETFASMQDLWDHCYRQKEQSADRWHPPRALSTGVDNHTLVLTLGDDGAFSMNDWSFSQLCRLAEVSKDTVTASFRAKSPNCVKSSRPWRRNSHATPIPGIGWFAWTSTVDFHSEFPLESSFFRFLPLCNDPRHHRIH